jgi:serine/threonine-protein kinase RsbW
MLKYEISFLNDLTELARLNVFIENAASDWGLSKEMVNHLSLVAEEVISNIILYGFKEGTTGAKIFLELSFNPGELTMRITDHGIEFNPLKVPTPDDLDKPVKDRKIGGLGVYFIRQLMDKVDYQRKEDSNILILTKKIS